MDERDIERKLLLENKRKEKAAETEALQRQKAEKLS